MNTAPATAPPITVLTRVRGGRWREVGTAATYIEAIALAEAVSVPGILWWFRTTHAAELVKEPAPDL